MDGLIILDKNNRPIIQTAFRTLPPSYPLLHIDAFTSAIEKNGSAIDPVLYVDSGESSVCCHRSAGGLHILCPMRGDVDPLFVFSFLEVVVQILQEYLGELSIASLKDNFDVVYQLLEEMLDEGYPLTTESNALRDIVIPPSLLNKILAVTGVSGLSTAAPAPFSSPIPWRKAGLRYNNNEIYFDIIEELEATVSRTGNIVASNVWGRVVCKSGLSGTPDLSFSLSNSKALHDYSFHPCVRLQKFLQTKQLSFVPPDGNFTLLTYQLPVPSPNPAAPPPLPIQLKSDVSLHERGGSFEIIVTARSSKMLENVCVEFKLGDSATGAECTHTGPGGQSAGGGFGALSVNGGSVRWGYDPQTKGLKWEIPSLTNMAQHLKGTFTSSDGAPRPSRSFVVTFEIPQHSLSTVKIDQLRISGESYKPYKGVRSSVEGRVEYRW
ncbi:AP-1 complex subunit mu [Rhizoctonia solani]|uniref:AP-1 complex subunit mu n=1 Tax=Rhizoctonia solani TaxID=456999 RepID=A0A0K6GEC1_9AGAM|nr:AP-1 complex subunit mu [Rhizoctonia solani]